jgi:hypothetical protein
MLRSYYDIVGKNELIYPVNLKELMNFRFLVFDYLHNELFLYINLHWSVMNKECIYPQLMEIIIKWSERAKISLRTWQLNQ